MISIETWSLSGLLRPDEAADITGLAFPESGDYETLAGLVLSRIGRLPEPGTAWSSTARP
jgi:CBS domain containing-hemolysin-like protein